MDFLQGIRDAEEDAMSYFLDENGEFQMPTMEQMQEALKHLNLAEKEKDVIWNRLLGNVKRKMGFPAGVLPLSDSPVIVQYILMVFFYVTIGLIVFFGYKLYKSLTEKQRRKDEKRKQKQLKKKK